MTAHTTKKQSTKIDDALEFSVPEFVAYERTLKWFILFFIVFATVIAFSVLSHDIILSVIIVLGSIVFYQITLTHPRTVTLRLSPNGVYFNKKERRWNEFQAFGLYERDNYTILHLEPLGNTMYPIIVPIPRSQHKEEVVHILRSILPQRLHPHITFSDWLLRFTRF